MDPINEAENNAMATIGAVAAAADIRVQHQQELKELGIDAILNQQTPPAVKITEITKEIVETCLNLKKFAHWNKYLSLAGLAANQCSIRGERCLLNVCFVNIDTKNFLHKDWVVAINPEIVAKHAPTYTATEGCLTWPGKQIRAVRYTGVVVHFKNLEGIDCERVATDFEAQVWQHEINHLNGLAEDVRDPAALAKCKPNDPCVCNSGKKFKRCCGR